jgi:hypothetical protein
MKQIAQAAVVAAVAGLVGCASGPFAPSPVGPRGLPYDGLNETSYGTRSTQQFRFCDPQDAQPGSGMLGDTGQKVATTLGSAVSAPLQGTMKIDATLQRLELASHFRAPADMGQPSVAVLSQAPDSIVFWFSAKSVRLAEVQAAAQAYCERSRASALYRGSATRCPAVERNLAGAPVLHTHAISAFACSPRR